MIDLGIGRIQDSQSTVPGVQSTERVRGDRPKEQGSEGSSVGSTNEGSKEKTAEKAQDGDRSPVTRQEVDQEIEKLNKRLGGQRTLQFRVNEETANIRIDIVDTESGEVIRTVPPSEIRNIADRFETGSLFVDDNI